MRMIENILMFLYNLLTKKKIHLELICKSEIFSIFCELYISDLNGFSW